MVVVIKFMYQKFAFTFDLEVLLSLVWKQHGESTKISIEIMSEEEREKYKDETGKAFLFRAFDGQGERLKDLEEIIMDQALAYAR